MPMTEAEYVSQGCSQVSTLKAFDSNFDDLLDVSEVKDFIRSLSPFGLYCDGSLFDKMVESGSIPLDDMIFGLLS
jgi:hypothetical protein